MQFVRPRSLLLMAAAFALFAASPLMAQQPTPEDATPRPRVTPTPDRTPVVPVVPPLERVAKTEFFMQRRMQGIFAELRLPAKPPRRPRTLTAYRRYDSRRSPANAALFNIRQIVVKFVEGSSIRLKEGTLAVSTDPAALETRARLARQGLEPQNVTAELAVLGKLLRTSQAVVGRAAP